MAELSAKRKRKQELERLLPIIMGRSIHANNAIAVAFFFYDPTADDNGWIICTTEAEVEAGTGAFIANNHGTTNRGNNIAAMGAVAADKEQILQ